MKKFVLLFTLLLVTVSFAQNLQVHYDLGEDREYVTTTLEMFKPDAMGATFWFVDMDYNQAGNKSASLAYWEIARYFKLPVADGKLSATIQYNDGTAPWGPLHNVVLAGLSYPINLGFITLNTDVLYRQMYTSDSPDVQLTLVWFKALANGKLNFMGFFDIWTQDDFTGEKQNVILSEPQLWYNVNSHIGIGGELEISSNFLPEDGFQYNPTIGMKWTF